MPTATLHRFDSANTLTPASSMTQRRPNWAVVLPLVFFACHGAFSFQSEGISSDRSLPGVAATRNPGLVGHLLIPGIVYLIVVWLIGSRIHEVVFSIRQFKMLSLLAILAVCSSLWSQDPMRSFLFGSLYSVDTLFGFYLVSHFELPDLSSFISKTGTIVCLIGLLMVAFFPHYAVYDNGPRSGGAWNGLFIDRTSAAKCLVFLLSPTLASWRRQIGVGRAVHVLLLSLMIVQARAVTSIVVLFIYIVFLIVLRVSRRLDRKLSIAAFFLVFSGMIVSVIVGIANLSSILEFFGRDITLSGRTQIWAAVTDSILKRPLLGYGYYAFWQDITGEAANVMQAVHWTFGYAHNGVLEIFLQLGSVGVFVFFLTFCRAIKDAWICFRTERSGRFDWYIGLLVLTVLYNIDEGTVAWPNELLSILYVVACCGLARAAKELKQTDDFLDTAI